MGGKRLTEPEYTTIKQLLENGYEGLKVAEILGRGTGTISTVKNSTDFNDYVKQRRERPAKKPKIVEQLELNVEDKRSDIFVAIEKVFSKVYEYRNELDDLGTLNAGESKAIDIALQRLQEAQMWLKTYL